MTTRKSGPPSNAIKLKGTKTLIFGDDPSRVIRHTGKAKPITGATRVHNFDGSRDYLVKAGPVPEGMTSAWIDMASFKDGKGTVEIGGVPFAAMLATAKGVHTITLRPVMEIGRVMLGEPHKPKRPARRKRT